MSYSLNFASNTTNIPLCWRLSEYLRLPVKLLEKKFYSVSMKDPNSLNVTEMREDLLMNLLTIYKIIRVVKIIFYVTLIGIPIVIISNAVAKNISEKYRKEFEISKVIDIYKKNIKKYLENFLVPETVANHEDINFYLTNFKMNFFSLHNPDNNTSNQNLLAEYLEKNRYKIKKLAPKRDYALRPTQPEFNYLLKWFPNLEELYLEFTGTNKLDIRNLKKLKKLHLRYNFIKIFDEKTFPLDGVENLEIDLRNNPRFAYVNSIKQIKKDHFHHCKNVTILIAPDNIKTFGNEMDVIRTKKIIEKDLNKYFNLKGQTNVIFKIIDLK